MKKLVFIVCSFFLIGNLFANNDFKRMGDSVIDNNLKLQWQDNPLSRDTKLFLEDAIKHCNNMDFLGLKDWRLASYEELLSLGDYEIYKPTINNIFKFTASGHYWTVLYKTTQLGEHITLKDYTEVRRIYFSDGFSYDNDRTGKAYVRCVRSTLKD
jgi:hypothetical protein